MLSSKLFALKRLSNEYDHLDQRFFLLTLLAAVLLHLSAMYFWSLLPRTEVIEVPVHALNIKLSDSDDAAETELKAAQPVATNSANVENTVSHLVRDENEEKQREQAVAKSMDKAMSSLDKGTETKTTAASPPVEKAAPSKAVVKGKFSVRAEGTKSAAPVVPVAARQFVRDNQAQETADNSANNTAGKNSASTSASTDSAHAVDLVSHYEQLISLWIQKFKIYPIDARSAGMQGETVVRIRIDRQGNIHYYALEHSTGYPLLDHAAIDMIRRANPVPAVPAEYPQGELMEFLIPVSFHLQP